MSGSQDTSSVNFYTVAPVPLIWNSTIVQQHLYRTRRSANKEMIDQEHFADFSDISSYAHLCSWTRGNGGRFVVAARLRHQPSLLQSNQIDDRMSEFFPGEERPLHWKLLAMLLEVCQNSCPTALI